MSWKALIYSLVPAGQAWPLSSSWSVMPAFGILGRRWRHAPSNPLPIFTPAFLLVILAFALACLVVAVFPK